MFTTKISNSIVHIVHKWSRLWKDITSERLQEPGWRTKSVSSLCLDTAHQASWVSRDPSSFPSASDQIYFLASVWNLKTLLTITFMQILCLKNTLIYSFPQLKVPLVNTSLGLVSIPLKSLFLLLFYRAHTFLWGRRAGYGWLIVWALQWNLSSNSGFAIPIMCFGVNNLSIPQFSYL